MDSCVILGDCKCFNADCEKVMGNLPDNSVDFILSDIPYDLDLNGGGAHGDFCTRKQIQSRKNSSLYFVSQGIDYDKIFSEFERICKRVNICVFCSNKQIGRIMTWWEQRGYVATLLVWDKPNPIPLGNGCYINNLEFIVYVREKGVTYNSLGYDMQLKTFRNQPPQAAQRIHETEKSPAFISKCLALLDLPQYLQDKIASGELSAKAARELASNYADPHDQVRAAKTAVRTAKAAGRSTATNKEVQRSLKDAKQGKAIADALRNIAAYLDGEPTVEVDTLIKLLDKHGTLHAAMREYKKTITSKN